MKCRHQGLPSVEGGGGRFTTAGLLQSESWWASRPRVKRTVEVVRKGVQKGGSAGSLSKTNGSSSVHVLVYPRRLSLFLPAPPANFVSLTL